PWGIAATGAANGGPLHSTQPIAPTRTLDPHTGPLVELLRGVVERGTGRGAAINGFAAGKTGTSQDYRDAWFIGFNESLIVGVWLGNDDNSPMRRVTGGSLPASIWREFVTAATPLVGRAPTTIAAAPGTETTGQGSAATEDQSATQTSAAQTQSNLC